MPLIAIKKKKKISQNFSKPIAPFVKATILSRAFHHRNRFTLLALEISFRPAGSESSIAEESLRVERPRVASAATRSRFPAFAFIVTSSRTDVTIIHFSRSILLLFSSFLSFLFFFPFFEREATTKEKRRRAAIAANPGQFIGIPLMGITRGRGIARVCERERERGKDDNDTRGELPQHD